MKLNMQYKMWLWHAFTHLVSILGVTYIIISQQYNYLWLLIPSIFIAGMFVNIGLHRYLSHGSFTTGPIRDLILRYGTVLTGLGPSIMWVTAHRHHHEHADTEHDFQNPNIIGSFRSWFTLYPKTTFSTKYGIQAARNPHNRFIYRHYFKIQFALYAIIALINPLLVVVLLAVPMIACFHGAASIGVITHLWGYRVIDSKDTSYNNVLASILSLGEGWHNYHHSMPRDHRCGHKWWEIDPPAWIIEKMLMTNDKPIRKN